MTSLFLVHLLDFSENESGAVDWIIIGNWRLNIANDMDIQNNKTSDVFNAAIEMIKPDGTARHTHTLTDFVVLNVSHPDNNSTLYNGTSTISLQSVRQPISLPLYKNQMTK